MAAINGFGELGYSGTDEKNDVRDASSGSPYALPLKMRLNGRALTMSKDAFPAIPPVRSGI